MESNSENRQEPPKRRFKVAVLGGGCGAMTAANYLSSTQELRDRYEVTVYQQGWRLGGKGATGRDPRQGYGDRIYEHGLHMWLGWYHNAFQMIQAIYDEWQKKPNNPFNSWEDAFKPQRLYTLQQTMQKGVGSPSWHSRNFNMPRLPGTPGKGETLLELAQYLEKLVRWLEDIVRSYSGFHNHLAAGIDDLLLPVEKFEDLAGKIEEALPTEERAHEDANEYLRPVIHGATRLRRARPWLDRDGTRQPGDPLSDWEHSKVLEMMEVLLSDFQHLLHKASIRSLAASSADLKWYWELMDLMVAIGLGMVREVIPNGVASINSENFHDWIGRCGADRDTRWCAAVRAVYNLAFAFEGGSASNTDPKTAKFEAGTALMVILRLGLGYKDAPMFRMMAGMGDTVFAPIYEVLAKQRGVKFEFFKRVTNLSLSSDRKVITAIDLDVQAQVKRGGAKYEPLFDLQYQDGKELPVWPEEPRWEQLVEGDALRDRLRKAETTLESAWCNEKVGNQRLVNGVDFDYIVLGISVAGVKMITPELSAASPSWSDMVNQLATVQTRAMQLWMDRTTEELGWTDGKTIQTTYAESLDTWAVMTDVLKRENWSGEDSPKSLQYFCGPLEGPTEPPLTDARYPKDKKVQVETDAKSWLNGEIGYLWPQAAGARGFDYNLLHDPGKETGSARFNSQYWRANVDPSERYVNSFPGTSVFRLRSDQSGFTNLYLAGDWTISSVNAGCVEAAVESGMAASRGICGVPIDIVNYPEP